MTYCEHAHLVGLDVELPADPAVAYDGGSPIIGCNNLVCIACGAIVRHADSRSTTSKYPPSRVEIEALYGDFFAAPFDDRSVEMVWVARRPGES